MFEFLKTKYKSFEAVQSITFSFRNCKIVNLFPENKLEFVSEKFQGLYSEAQSDNSN